MPRSRWKVFATALFAAALATAAASARAALPEIIDAVKPAVVVVGTYAKSRSPAFVMRGTGFAVGKGSLVATNAHVIPGSLNADIGEVLIVQTRTASGGLQARVATSAASDPAHDLALLRIEGAPLPALKLGGASPVREGQEVAFTGFPTWGASGLSPVRHCGMISSLTPIAIPGATANQLNEKAIKRLKSGAFEVYQLDGTAYPGNSGGPLFETQSGEVIGVINMVFVKGSKESALTHPSGISFAVPVIYLQELLQTLP